MATVTTYRCDRCGHESVCSGSMRSLFSSPVREDNQRKEADLCYACQQALRDFIFYPSTTDESELSK